MRLIVLSDEAMRSDELHVLRLLCNEGLSTFHLRKPKATRQELETYLRALPEDLRRVCVIHEHVELAEEWGLRGVHLASRPFPELRRRYLELRASIPGIRLSASLHHLGDVAAIGEESFEYLFLSPIYESISKPNYGPGDFSSSTLFETLGRSNQRVIALGGVSKNSIERAAVAGFCGVAVLGAIWKATDPVVAFRELETACRRRATFGSLRVNREGVEGDTPRSGFKL